MSSEEAFVRGEQYQTTITNLMALGFDHDQVVRALRASFHNPDRAAEYLFGVSILCSLFRGLSVLTSSLR